MIKLFQDLTVPYIMTKFGADWLLLFLKMLECKQSQIKQFFLIQGQITPDVTVGFDQ